ncbi:MAG: hypothetical protein JXR03_18455 [Cyclobacteriaceae bacterium]
MKNQLIQTHKEDPVKLLKQQIKLAQGWKTKGLSPDSFLELKQLEHEQRKMASLFFYSGKILSQKAKREATITELNDMEHRHHDYIEVEHTNVSDEHYAALDKKRAHLNDLKSQLKELKKIISQTETE